MSEWWTAHADEISDRLNMLFSKSQTEDVADVIESAHSLYSENHGEHEADKSLWRQQSDKLERLKIEIAAYQSFISSVFEVPESSIEVRKSQKSGSYYCHIPSLIGN